MSINLHIIQYFPQYLFRKVTSYKYTHIIAHDTYILQKSLIKKLNKRLNKIKHSSRLPLQRPKTGRVGWQLFVVSCFNL